MSINARNSSLSYSIENGVLGIYSNEKCLSFTVAANGSKGSEQVKITTDVKIYLALAIDASPNADELIEATRAFRITGMQDSKYTSVHVAEIPITFFLLQSRARQNIPLPVEDEKGIVINPPPARFFTPYTFFSEDAAYKTSALNFRAALDEFPDRWASATLVDRSINLKINTAIVMLFRKGALIHHSHPSCESNFIESKVPNIMNGDLVIFLLPQNESPKMIDLSTQIIDLLAANPDHGFHHSICKIQTDLCKELYVISATIVVVPKTPSLY